MEISSDDDLVRMGKWRQCTRQNGVERETKRVEWSIIEHKCRVCDRAFSSAPDVTILLTL